MRLTILHAFLTLAALACGAPRAAAQAPSPAGPFDKGAWHFETDVGFALEAWNYNISHEELFGFRQGVTYGLRDGIVLRASQQFFYVSQRSQDAVLLGLTVGGRFRIAQKGRVMGFLQGDLGISYTAIAAPPRGTRFNYLAIGGGGVLVRLRPRVHFVGTLQLIHVSNNGIKGPGRNPDIEAIGPAAGLLFRF
jgi:hypothetical protein